MVRHRRGIGADGGQLAAVTKLGYFDNMAASHGGEVASVVQSHVWQATGEGDALRIDMIHPCGESVNLWPSSDKVDPWRGEKI